MRKHFAAEESRPGLFTHHHNICKKLFQLITIDSHRAFFNYITTGAFTPVGPLLAPVVKHDFQINRALLIISNLKSTLLKMLHLPALSDPLTLSTFPLRKVKGRGGSKRELWVWNTPNCQVVGKLSNPSWIGRKETITFD
jgi:hypothetical protein